MTDPRVETATDDLAEARGKIDAARAVLQQALDAGRGDLEPIRQAVAQLDRLAAEVARVEGVCAARLVTATA